MTFERNFLAGSLGAGAVFTRASTAWSYNAAGTLVSSANDVPRFDYDPATLQMKGLLLEDTSTNIVFPSGDLANAGWTHTNTTATANQTVAPDGTTTAARVAFSGGNLTVLAQLLTVTANPYTFSVWVRGTVGGERIWLMTTPNGTTYYSAQAIATTTWQRFTLTTPALTAGPWYIQIGIDNRDATQVIQPAMNVFVWGAQVEAVPYGTSYIPTTAATVTRARDVLSYPIASVTGFDATKGTLALDYILEGVAPGYSAPVQFVGANIATDYIDCDEYQLIGSTGTVPLAAGGGVWANGGSPFAYATFSSPIAAPAGVVHRAATAWAVGANMAAAHDGTGSTSVSGTNPVASLPAIVNLTVGGPMHGQFPVSQWTRRVRYWPRQLSQAELISVTS